jgi:hypothetical protein
MHKIANLTMCLVLLLGMAGCAKKSEIKGSVVDAQGRPLAGLKIIASHVRPVKKGYERFETVSDSDGAFAFEKLYPSSAYVLKPQSNRWRTDAELHVKTAADGEIIVLPQPLTIRYTFLKEKIIADSLTDLEWFPGPSRDMDWHLAQAWIKKLSVAGGGWRMPTAQELKSLYDESVGAAYKIDPAFTLSACCVWTGEKIDAVSARNFSFKPRIREHGRMVNSYRNRAFAVRSRP